MINYYVHSVYRLPFSFRANTAWSVEYGSSRIGLRAPDNDDDGNGDDDGDTDTLQIYCIDASSNM